MVREGLSNNQQDKQKLEEGREQIPWLLGTASSKALRQDCSEGS